MYDELKERCRICSQGCSYPSECSYFNKPPFRCMRQLLSESADAIEELLTLKALADAKIERLENAKVKKKRPPKRLPCTCGRKQLELWWSNEGWFLKCPNCGRESKPERYQSHVNFSWNKGLSEQLKEENHGREV